MWWGTADQYILPKLLALRLLVGLLAAVLVVRWVRDRRISWRRTALDLPIATLVASAALSTAVAENRNLALFGAYTRYEGLLTIAAYAAVFWLVAQHLAGEGSVRTLTRALLLAGCIAAFLGALQVIGESSGATGGGESAIAFGGVYRATSTFGNANALGAFLAMLVPLAASEAVRATTTFARVVAVDVLVLLLMGLALTFSRSAWLGAACGATVMAATSTWVLRHRRAVALGAGAVAVAVAIVVVAARGGVPTARAVTTRASSMTSPGTGTGGTRVHIWLDTLGLVASRPITGYGPDNFALAFPRYATGNWTPGDVLDKAHSDVLEVAATQGLLGAGAYAWLLGAAGAVLWRGRRRPHVVPLLGAFVAYQVTEQLNFSYLPSAAPAWILLAAAAVAAAEGRRHEVALQPVPGRALAVGVSASLAAVAVPAVVQPYRGDVAYLAALGSAIDDRAQARAHMTSARGAAPWQAVYAIEAGDLAEGLDSADQPSTEPDWAAAHDAYEDAERLGCASSIVFRHLVIADLHLGLQDEAVAAARRAVELDRYDGANIALLRDVGG